MPSGRGLAAFEGPPAPRTSLGRRRMGRRLLLYVGALDGWLHAIDARTGRLVWKVDTLIGRDERKPYTITGAPQLAGDLVVIGNGGADFAGVRHVSAYDRKSGALLQRFYTVPRDPAQGPQDQPHLVAALGGCPKPPWAAAAAQFGTEWPTIRRSTVYIGAARTQPPLRHEARRPPRRRPALRGFDHCRSCRRQRFHGVVLPDCPATAGISTLPKPCSPTWTSTAGAGA